MARLSVVLLLLLSAALAAQATDDEVCSDPGFKPIKLKGGVPATKPVAGIIAQLDKRVRVEAVRNDGCRVTSTKLEKACQKVVRKGQTLDRDDTKASASGALIDVQLVARIKCKDGKYNVRYEARGIKAKGSYKLKNIQTRFIDVFGSTYV
jgi:hypothetical protein